MPQEDVFARKQHGRGAMITSRSGPLVDGNPNDRNSTYLRAFSASSFPIVRTDGDERTYAGPELEVYPEYRVPV
jgi:hypothetical protein